MVGIDSYLSHLILIFKNMYWKYKYKYISYYIAPHTFYILPRIQVSILQYYPYNKTNGPWFFFHLSGSKLVGEYIF